MKILLTGADGMLGSNLTRELLARKHQVRAFLLPNSSAKSLNGLGIERFEGNILQEQDIEMAAEDCDAIINVAANTNIWPNRSEIVRKVNYDGVVNMINVVKKLNINRFIQIGTANSFGFGSKASPGNEVQPYRSAQYGLDYMDSKYEAQELIIRESKENGLPAIVVCPTFMFGPYDSKPGAGAMILAIHSQKVPGYASGGRNYIAAKDVAVAIANALTMGRIGECYIAGHQNLNYKEAFETIAEVVGVKAPTLKIPAFASKIYGAMGSTYGNLFNKQPQVSYAMAKISSDEHFFSAQKAIDELNLPQTDIKIAIKECFDWLKENKYC